MPPRVSGPKKLLVEGSDDKHVVLHIRTQLQPSLEFEVDDKGDVDQLIRSIRDEVVAPGCSALGMVVDANTDVQARWRRVSDQLAREGIQLPSTPNPNGTVVSPGQGHLPQVGVWLMPDNQSPGELEDFLSSLVPNGDVVWPLAQQYVHQVPTTSLGTKPSKALVHAWLATRLGGARLGTAIGAGVFNLQAGVAQTFLRWLDQVFS